MSSEVSKQRTVAQNASLHLYLTWVAKELNNQGQTLQNVVQKINKVEIRPSMQNLKEVVWHEIQKVMTGKESSAFLTKQEINDVYEVMAAWLAKNFEISLPWPSDEELQMAKLADKPVDNTIGKV